MERSPDLIRALMLRLESARRRVSGEDPIEGYTRDQVAYHLALIVKSGYADGPAPRYPSDGRDPTIPLTVMANRLTRRVTI